MPVPGASAVAISASGSHIAVGLETGSIQIWEPGAKTARASLEGHRGAISSVAFSPDSSQLASAAIAIRGRSLGRGLRRGAWPVAGPQPSGPDAHVERRRQVPRLGCGGRQRQALEPRRSEAGRDPARPCHHSRRRRIFVGHRTIDLDVGGRHASDLGRESGSIGPTTGSGLGARPTCHADGHHHKRRRHTRRDPV